MEIEFQNTKSDYLEYYKAQLKKSLLNARLIIILIFILLFCSFPYGDNFSLPKFAINASVIIIMIVALYYIVLYRAVIKNNKNIAVDPEGYLNEKKLLVTDDGITLSTATKTDFFVWQGITSVGSISKFIYIILANKRVIIIPSSNIPAGQAANLIGIVETNIFRSRGLINFNAYKVNKPPYSLGWLGVIPLVGGFVGIGLMLYGIFKYKDRKLILIGTAGLLFTIGVYSSLFYESKYGHSFDEGKIQLTRMQLNSLIKNIEFYKIQHGTYPDSLTQINKDDSTVQIHDFILNSNNNLFNYQKTGSNYYLFSSGVDKIPHTKDDLYPTITNVDSSKTGWIKK